MNKIQTQIIRSEISIVITVVDGVATICGLEKVKLGELLDFFNAKSQKMLRGMALNLKRFSTDAVLFGDEHLIQSGFGVEGKGRVVDIPAGKCLLGRVINPLGDCLDGSTFSSEIHYFPVEIKAPGIIRRGLISEPMLTGLKVIDSLIPIGRGQRELIIGDRQIGKTSIALDTILNQAKENMRDPSNSLYCVYTAIGQKRSSISQIVKLFNKFNVLTQSVIIAATASESAPLQYLAPYSGCTVAEYFRDNGMHALIIFDDLSKQAVSYRQMSLLLRRPPGREAYPGDVFYLHSRLLERSAKLSINDGGGSLTGLPIVETYASDVSAYIPTNVISITDGQIFLDSFLFYNGTAPAVNVGLSVSRVGSAAQLKVMRQVAGSLKLKLAQYREIQGFEQFESDLDDFTKSLLTYGQMLVRLLTQNRFSPLGVENQAIILFAGLFHLLDFVNLTTINHFEHQFNIFLNEMGFNLPHLFLSTINSYYVNNRNINFFFIVNLFSLIWEYNQFTKF